MKFESIHIMVRYGKDQPKKLCEIFPYCCECDEFYEIYPDGLITYGVCCESSSLDKQYDLDRIMEVINILEHAIEMIRKHYNLGRP